MSQLKKLSLASLLLVPVFMLALTASARAEITRTRVQEKIEERVSEDKKRLNRRLSESDEKRIKNKCKASQNLVAAYTKKVDNFETSRQKVYGKIIERLDSLSTNLQTGHSDEAATVATLKTDLQNKVDEVYAAIDDFQQTLSDLSAVDCTADPTAFQAVLEAARSYRSTINEKTKAVRSYYSDTVVKSLSDIKNKLSASSEGDN